jgi:hypothetical protein
MQYCCSSAVMFAILGLWQYSVYMSLLRLAATLAFASTTYIFHWLYRYQPGSLWTEYAYNADQIFIWPCGMIILSDDMSLSICTLVGIALACHFLFKPLTDYEHCMLVHMPIMLAMVLQDVKY